MKKVLIIALILGFVGVGNAVADEDIAGFCFWTYIQIYESQPCGTGEFDCGERIQACDVDFTFFTPNGQVYELTGTAYGTALNLAILKALNFGETTSCRLTYRFVPGFDIEVDWVDFVAFNGGISE